MLRRLHPGSLLRWLALVGAPVGVICRLSIILLICRLQQLWVDLVVVPFLFPLLFLLLSQLLFPLLISLLVAFLSYFLLLSFLLIFLLLFFPCFLLFFSFLPFFLFLLFCILRYEAAASCHLTLNGGGV